MSNSQGELNLVYLFQTRTSNGITTVLSWSWSYILRDNYVTAYTWPEMTITKRAPYIIIHLARNAQGGGEVCWCQSCFQSLDHSCACWFPGFHFRILDSRFQLFHMPNVKHLGVDTSVNYIAPVENSVKVLEMQRKTGFWLLSFHKTTCCCLAPM